LFVAKPHIGNFRLVGMIKKTRGEIEALGGEVRFGQRMTDLQIETDAQVRQQVQGVVLDSGQQVAANHIVMALGHNARDTFEMLAERGVYMEAKPFSIRFRVEHPQGLIDRARFGASAGIVVGISPQDYRQDGRSSGPVNPSDGMAFQRFWESRAFKLGYCAPGQRGGDFLQGCASTAFDTVQPSYQLGVTPTDLNECGRGRLPGYGLAAIREALPACEGQIKGFAMPDNLLTGVETRTSSSLRISRGRNLQSLNVAGLYPAGEGARFAKPRRAGLSRPAAPGIPKTAVASAALRAG